MTSATRNVQQAPFVLGVFALWTVTSFLCHYAGKTYLILMDAHEKDFQTEWITVAAWQSIRGFTLTMIQLSFCAYFIQPEGSGMPARQANVAKYTHALATLATNLSMSMMYASSTFAIKLMEPITSALLQYFMLGTPLTLWTQVSLPIIVGGAIMFTGNPFAVTSTAFGVLLAFASNLILALRNISIKKMQAAGQQQGTTSININKKRLLPGLTFILLIYAGIHVLEKWYGFSFEGSSTIAMYGLISATFHVAYSYTSTSLVLDKISVVSHAVANISKRVLVVVLLYSGGQRVASPSSWLGFAVCTLGLLIYTYGKTQINAGDKALHGKGWSSKSTVTRRLSKRTICLSLVPFICVLFLLIRSSRVTETYMHINTVPFMRRLRVYNDASSDLPAIFDQRSTRYGDFPPAMYGLRDSRGPIGFRKPSVGELSPNMSRIPFISKDTVQSFLNKRLLNNTIEANFLSKQFTQTADVIKETQRLHFNIIEDAIKGYKYGMLIDIASFENKGDPCITMGETYFLGRIGLPLIYYCNSASCTSTNLKRAAEIAKKYSPEELVILLHGGGNLILYPSRDAVRFKFLPMLKQYTMVVFPQSLTVKDYDAYHTKRCITAYCCNPKMTIILRDRLSYDIAAKIFKGSTKLVMAPDMAFQMGHMPRFLSPVYDILWIRREDQEAIGYKISQTEYKGYKIHISDWLGWKTPRGANGLEQAFYTGTNGFFYLQRGRVIITDRLHGHILATMMDIPHVIVDNKYFKISRYHNTWTKSIENTLMTSDPKEALDLAVQLLKKYESTLPPRVPFLDVKESLK